MSIPTDVLGVAAEFAVASELCRRGIYAQLTLGRRKRTDLLVETDGGFRRVEVKAKQVREWAWIKGISDKDGLIVFVDYRKKLETDRPDFYILTAKDRAKLVKKTLTDRGHLARGFVVIDEEHVPRWTKTGHAGLKISPPDIVGYKQAWAKFHTHS